MALFGIDPDIYLTGAGYLQAQLFSFIAPIILIAFAVGFGVSATAGEEKIRHHGHAPLPPITRRSLILQKAAAMVLLASAPVVCDRRQRSSSLTQSSDSS